MAFQDDLKKAVERAVRIIKLERPAISEVAADESALVPGIAIVAIAGLSAGLGSLVWGNVAGPVMMPVLTVLMSFVGVGLWYVVGLLFKPARWDFMEIYRAASHTHLLGWAGIVSAIPILGQLALMLVGIYQIVVSVVVIEEVGRVDRAKAVVIVVLPIVVCCGAVALFAGTMIMAALGLASAGR